MTSVYIFDTRSFLAEKKKEILDYITLSAFMVNEVVVANAFVGYVAYLDIDPTSYYSQIPYNCPCKNVSSWDLLNMEQVFVSAFIQTK